jgi:SSS family transporter
MHATLTSLDLGIIASYLAALATIGVIFSRRQTSLDALLVAGGRMPWLPVGLSLMAALNSGIDYLTQPSATIQYGLVLLVGTLSWLVVSYWVSAIAFPFYRRLRFYSVYEYLEVRFDVRVRTLAAGIFVAWRLGWMATALYVPCLAIHAVTGGAIDLTVMIVVLGALVTLYTMLGGIKAVIWNDVIQFGVMFSGLAATVYVVASNVPGGLAEVWRTAQDAGKTSLWVAWSDESRSGVWPAISAFFTQPVTVPALLSGLIVGRLAQYTSDQVMVQRIKTTQTLGDARHAFAVNAAGDVLWMAGLSFVGLALFASFNHNPAPAGLPADRMLPYFMATAFPAGVVGLVIAAILAASLSSIDSAIHACSSVLLVDGYHRLVRGQPAAPWSAPPTESPRSEVVMLRLASLLVGAAGTVLACSVPGIGTLIEIANKLINAFTGPLFGIFVLAMFTTRVGALAVLAGGMAGAIASYGVAYHSPIGFLWPSTFGLVTTILVAAAVALARRDAPNTEALTWWAVMKQPLMEGARAPR